MITLRTAIVAASLLFFAACGGEAAKPAAPPTGDVPKAPIPSDLDADISAEILGKLAKADAADGKTDKVVEKCAGCSLGMNGSTAHAVKVGGYTLQFCDHCADGKAKDPMKVLTALVVK